MHLLSFHRRIVSAGLLLMVIDWIFENCYKKQGYRIELGEIECAIKACQAVTQGCCFYQAATQQIVCCYSGEDDEKALRGELRRRLPKYMLPDVYYHLPQFPQTMNGKIDRVRLRQELGL